MRRFISTIRVTLSGICVAITVAYALALYVRLIAGLMFGDGWWVLALADTFALYLFVPLPFFALIAILTRKRPALLAVLAGIVLFAGQYGSLFVPLAWRVRPVTASALRVMTFNIPFPGYGDDEQALADHILEQKADILFTQELTTFGVQVLQQRLRGDYPYVLSELSSLPYEGKLIFSKYPLRLERIINATTKGRPTQVAIATIGGRDVVLVNMHPTSTYGVSRLKDLPYAVNVTYRMRESEIMDVMDSLAGETRPIVIAGDMNTTDQTVAYRMLTTTFQDSWREAGTGLGLTFPAPVFRLSDIPLPIPNRLKAPGGLLDRPVTGGLLRLDHILHSSDFRATLAQTVVIGQSDHIALVTDLVWAD